MLELLAHTERVRVQLRWLAGLCHCDVPTGEEPLDPYATCRWQRDSGAFPSGAELLTALFSLLQVRSGLECPLRV